MTVTTRKSNATAHPGVPDLPKTSRRSSKEVAKERKATAHAQAIQSHTAWERVQAVADLEHNMAEEDAKEQMNAAHPHSKPDNS
jgi:hypothetical protein